MALFIRDYPGWTSTRKVKPIGILLKQETVSGSGISRATCKSAPHSRQITTPAPNHSVFTRQMPDQQHQSTEGKHKNRTAQHVIISQPTTSYWQFWNWSDPFPCTSLDVVQILTQPEFAGSSDTHTRTASSLLVAGQICPGQECWWSLQ